MTPGSKQVKFPVADLIDATSDAQALLRTYTDGDFTGSDPLALSQIAAPSAAPDRAEGSSGAMTGTFYYTLSFVTAVGETEIFFPAQAITVTAKRVVLTNIPTGPTGVTARKIYRGDNSGYEVKLLTTINDNTTTTYTDNAAAGSLSVYPRSVNRTGGYITVNDAIVMAADPSVTILGVGKSVNSSGIENTLLGKNTGHDLTTGYWLTFVGSECGENATVAYECTGVGYRALQDLVNGWYTVGLGSGAGQRNASGIQNLYAGAASGFNNDGSSSTFLGFGTGQNMTDGDFVIVIGDRAANYAADGTTPITTSYKSIYIGTEVRGATAASDVNVIVIGCDAISEGANTTTIGNSNTQRCVLWGYTQYKSIASETITPFARLSPSGTSASRGNGVAVEWQAQPSDQDALFTISYLIGTFGGGSGYASARATMRVVNSVGGFDDVMTWRDAKVGVGTLTPAVALDVVSPATSAINSVAAIAPNGALGARGKGVGQVFRAQPTDQNSAFDMGRIYGIFDSTTYGSARLTMQVFDSGGSLVDRLSVTDAGVLINADGSMELVTAGAADSGGTGYKLLRIPN